MKKLFLLCILCFISFFNRPIHAEPIGRAAQSGVSQGSTDWAWTIGIVGIVVLVAMGGVIASSATDSPVTFSH